MRISILIGGLVLAEHTGLRRGQELGDGTEAGPEAQSGPAESGDPEELPTEQAGPEAQSGTGEDASKEPVAPDEQEPPMTRVGVLLDKVKSTEDRRYLCGALPEMVECMGQSEGACTGNCVADATGSCALRADWQPAGGAPVEGEGSTSSGSSGSSEGDPAPGTDQPQGGEPGETEPAVMPPREGAGGGETPPAQGEDDAEAPPPQGGQGDAAPPAAADGGNGAEPKDGGRRLQEKTADPAPEEKTDPAAEEKTDPAAEEKTDPAAEEKTDPEDPDRRDEPAPAVLPSEPEDGAMPTHGDMCPGAALYGLADRCKDMPEADCAKDCALVSGTCVVSPLAGNRTMFGAGSVQVAWLSTVDRCRLSEACDATDGNCEEVEGECRPTLKMKVSAVATAELVVKALELRGRCSTAEACPEPACRTVDGVCAPEEETWYMALGGRAGLNPLNQQAVDAVGKCVGVEEGATCPEDCATANGACVIADAKAEEILAKLMDFNAYAVNPLHQATTLEAGCSLAPADCSGASEECVAVEDKCMVDVNMYVDTLFGSCYGGDADETLKEKMQCGRISTADECVDSCTWDDTSKCVPVVKHTLTGGGEVTVDFREQLFGMHERCTTTDATDCEGDCEVFTHASGGQTCVLKETYVLKTVCDGVEAVPSAPGGDTGAVSDDRAGGDGGEVTEEKGAVDTEENAADDAAGETTTTEAPATVTKVTGSMSFQAAGLTEAQVSAAAKTTLVSTLGVAATDLSVAVTKGRRLQEGTADSWTVTYEAVVEATAAAALKTKAETAAAAGKAAFEAALTTNLKAEVEKDGGDASAITGVTVTMTAPEVVTEEQTTTTTANMAGDPSGAWHAGAVTAAMSLALCW